LLPLSVCAMLVAVDEAGTMDDGRWTIGPGIVHRPSSIVHRPSSIVHRPLWLPALWAGLFVAATAVTYHPALTAFVAMVGPIALVTLVRSLRKRATWRLLLSIGLAVVVAVLLSLGSQLKSIDGFLKQ